MLGGLAALLFVAGHICRLPPDKSACYPAGDFRGKLAVVDSLSPFGLFAVKTML